MRARTAVCLLAAALSATAWAQQKIDPMEALRLVYGQKNYASAVKVGPAVLWSNIKQPEALMLYASALERTGQREPAAVFYSILLNILETSSAADVAKYRKPAEKDLAALNGAWERQKADYAKKAPGKTFTTPEAVDDLWMVNVQCTPHPLHGMYAWRLVGGRKDLPATWIHNAKGEMHRSSAKYFDEVHGRKGLLFCVPNKKSHMTSTVATRNVGKGKFLRVGTMGYHFTCVLNVVVAGKEIFSQVIGKDAWQDLRIDLLGAAGKDVPVTLELVVPEEQGPYEGIWFDYVDFFEN